jgi:hypothetical protein
MTTADWALIVSLCSFPVALSGFVAVCDIETDGPIDSSIRNHPGRRLLYVGSSAVGFHTRYFHQGLGHAKERAAA